jgi:hypothetical protein
VNGLRSIEAMVRSPFVSAIKVRHIPSGGSERKHVLIASLASPLAGI